ncbi:MAG: hypothetical protein HQ541_16155 [Mariniphaga sp.]|nr:hypothetical protein [Mariniphaga sp.]
MGQDFSCTVPIPEADQGQRNKNSTALSSRHLYLLSKEKHEPALEATVVWYKEVKIEVQKSYKEMVQP